MDAEPNDNQPYAIWWLKKDFRLADNPALTAAIASGRPVLPVFIIEPSALRAPETSAFHVAALLEAFRELRTRLRAAGGDLCVLQGEIEEVFDRLRSTVAIGEVHSHEEVGTDRTFQRDRRFAQWCREHGIAWHEHRQTGVFRRLSDRDSRSRKWKAWYGGGPIAEPTTSELQRIDVPQPVLDLRDAACRRPSLKAFRFSLPEASRRQRQRVSERHAAETLESFLRDRGVGYSAGISSPNTAFLMGSRLSVHLAWGTITGRTVYDAVERRLAELKESDDPGAGAWRRSISAFRSRLHWRDHFVQRLETEPDMEFHPLNRAYDRLPRPEDWKRRLTAWGRGETGFPLVDACIRCTRTTGFLNFRMRSMITSVACHALRLSWRDILWPMARWWADYEPGIHVSQLQMQAGVVGINTLRTYNPAKQIADHDADTAFIKRWVPELRPFSAEAIIAHQESPIAGYIPPLVDWKASTAAMRADYYAIRRDPETKRLAEAVFERHGSRKSSRSRRPPSKKPAAAASATPTKRTTARHTTEKTPT